MHAMAFPLTVLFATAACAALAVLAQSARHALTVWGELRHALETCPERQICRITHIELLVRPAPGPAPLRLVSPWAPRQVQPALRAAA